MRKPETLSEALDLIYGDGINWYNPIRPHLVSGITQTPFEAYEQLNPEYRLLVNEWLGHKPCRDEL